MGKNAGEVIGISLNECRKHWFIGCRKYYQADDELLNKT
jgi:hypothetical protein